MQAKSMIEFSINVSLIKAIKVMMLISNPNKILTLNSIPILISKLVNSVKAVLPLLIYCN